MKKFVFRLATLLKLREADRDQRRSELADAQRALTMIDERITELHNEMESARQAVRQSAGVGHVAVDMLLDNQRYELMLMAEKKSIDTQRAQVADEADRRREVVVEADRSVKTLEKLRDREQRRHREEAERRDAKQLDEIAVRAHAVRTAER
jgi:flagellar FliJ protein